jgi:DNA-directed RNA polymerase beta' subunit
MEYKYTTNIQNIFNEINKIIFDVYEQIKDKHLDTTGDIAGAIADTDFYDTIREFEIYGSQYDVNQIMYYIEEYVYWEIVKKIETEVWNKE